MKREKAVKTSKRSHERKAVNGLKVSNLTAYEKFALLSREATLVDASATGLLIVLERKNLIPQSLRSNLSLDSLVGERVMFRIQEMDLEMEGFVSRTKVIKAGLFEVAIDFSADAPEYWRLCFMDLLPNGDEFDGH
jgi:hypothetical protein